MIVNKQHNMMGQTYAQMQAINQSGPGSSQQMQN